MPGAKTKMTYEKAVAELEVIVEKLEGGEAGLDEALALFERGMELLHFCEEKLTAAEGKVEKIIEKGESLLKVPLDEDEDAEDLEE